MNDLERRKHETIADLDCERLNWLGAVTVEQYQFSGSLLDEMLEDLFEVMDLINNRRKAEDLGLAETLLS